MEQFLGTRTIKLETSGHLIEQDSSNTNTRQTYCSISMTKRHSDDDQYNARARQFKSFLQVGIYVSTSTLFFHEKYDPPLGFLCIYTVTKRKGLAKFGEQLKSKRRTKTTIFNFNLIFERSSNGNPDSLVRDKDKKKAS